MQSPLQKWIARLTLIRQHIESIDTACEGLYFDNVSSFRRSSRPLQSSQPFLMAITQRAEMSWPWSRIGRRRRGAALSVKRTAL